MCFITQACFFSLSISLNGRSQHATRRNILRDDCKVFFPVDFLQGLYRGSPTIRYNITRGSHIGPFTIRVSFCFAIARRVFLSGRFPTRFVQEQPRNRTEKKNTCATPQTRKQTNDRYQKLTMADPTSLTMDKQKQGRLGS